MKQAEILVSVVLVSYNQEQYIEQALQSIVMQKTEFEYEIIIGDDASSDKTTEIIEEFIEKNRITKQIQFVKRKENVGATRNAYELMKMCRGDFIAYIEGDDYWTDEMKLQKQTQFLITHPEYFGCCCRFSIVNNQGQELKKYHLDWVTQKKRFSISDYDGFHLPSQSSTYLRRNIYKSPKFDYSILYKTNRTIGDRLSVVVYLLHGDYYCFCEKMSAYRLPNRKRCSGSYIAYENEIERISNDLKIYQVIVNLLKEHGKTLKSDYALRRVYYDTLLKYMKTGKRELKDCADEILNHVESPWKCKCLFFPFAMSRVLLVMQKVLYKRKLEM